MKCHHQMKTNSRLFPTMSPFYVALSLKPLAFVGQNKAWVYLIKTSVLACFVLIVLGVPDVLAQYSKPVKQLNSLSADLPSATIYASHGNVKMTVIKREKLAGKTILKSVESWLKNGDVVPVGAVIETAENSFATIALNSKLSTNEATALSLKAKQASVSELESTKITRVLGNLATLAAKSSIKILALPSYGSQLGIELLLISGQVDSRVLTQEKNNSTVPINSKINPNTNPYYQVRAKLVTASVRGTHFRVALMNNEKVQSSVIDGSVDLGSINPKMRQEAENNPVASLGQYHQNHQFLASLTKSTGLVLSPEHLLNTSENKTFKDARLSPLALLTAPEWLGFTQPYPKSDVKLEWKPLKNIRQYRIQIAKDEYFLDILDQQEILLNNDQTVEKSVYTNLNIEAEGAYFARISAFDNNGIEGNYQTLKLHRNNYSLIANSKLVDKKNLIHFYWNELPIQNYQLIINSLDEKRGLVQFKNINKNNIEVDIANFPTGVYKWQIIGTVQDIDKQITINSAWNQFIINN